MKNLVIACVFAGVVTLPGAAQTADKYQSLSRELVAAGQAALKVDKATDAQGYYERALVADPANVMALVGLGRAHEVQGRVGRGLKYYRQALDLEPNDLVALELQATAFLKRDMLGRAEDNREKLARLCQAGCGALDKVESALEAYRAEKADAGDTTVHAEAKKDG